MSLKSDYEQPSYFKLWTRDWMQGSMRYNNTPAERGFFVDMTAMANECRGRREKIPVGAICISPDIPLSHTDIARRLMIEPEEFEKHLAKMKEQGRITEDDKGIITIVNFGYYQWRGKKKRKEQPPDDKGSKYKEREND